MSRCLLTFLDCHLCDDLVSTEAKSLTLVGGVRQFAPRFVDAFEGAVLWISGRHILYTADIDVNEQ